ncbi:MAG: hypothetical protein LJE92_10175 [Gammaproteobacteria bacterium]|jgi:hypothetical protein|nr:hypothetical protein [Gammaproteobacteria bacterium]
MPDTLIIQSHRHPLPHAWLQACLDSVAGWAQVNGYHYRYLGDEIFALLDRELLDKTRAQPVIASDLARLISLQQGLAEGYDCVVWCDADFLIFDPDGFVLPECEYALGREIWVQHDAKQRLRSFAKVHNALLMFRRGNSFLDFYRASAERLLRLNQGRMAPQFIGPKWLTAVHNIALCPVMESAAMLSPLVMRDCLAGQGEALRLFRSKSPVAPAGANLSSSLSEREGLSDLEMNSLIEILLQQGI